MRIVRATPNSADQYAHLLEFFEVQYTEVREFTQVVATLLLGRSPRGEVGFLPARKAGHAQIVTLVFTSTV